MNKNIILETINRLGNDSFGWSEQITDNYLKTKKIYEVTGYGIYDSTAENRFCLLIDLPNNQKGTLTTLLMNPANTFPADIAKTKGIKARFDQTIRNLIILANAIGYKQIIVLNTFPYIEGSGEKANDYYDCNINSEKFRIQNNREPVPYQRGNTTRYKTNSRIAKTAIDISNYECLCKSRGVIISLIYRGG